MCRSWRKTRYASLWWPVDNVGVKVGGVNVDARISSSEITTEIAAEFRAAKTAPKVTSNYRQQQQFLLEAALNLLHLSSVDVHLRCQQHRLVLSGRLCISLESLRTQNCLHMTIKPVAFTCYRSVWKFPFR